MSVRKSATAPGASFCWPALDYALRPELFWYRGEMVAAYDAVQILAQARDPKSAAFEMAAAMCAGIHIFSPVQRDRFWADVQRGVVVAWEHATPHITGVFLRPDRKAQVPVYDWQKLMHTVAAATETTSRLKRKIDKFAEADLRLAEEHCQRYLLDNRSDILPAYQL